MSEKEGSKIYWQIFEGVSPRIFLFGRPEGFKSFNLFVGFLIYFKAGFFSLI